MRQEDETGGINRLLGINFYRSQVEATSPDPTVLNTIPIRSGWHIHLSKISFFVLLKPLSVTMR